MKIFASLILAAGIMTAGLITAGLSAPAQAGGVSVHIGTHFGGHGHHHHRKHYKKGHRHGPYGYHHHRPKRHWKHRHHRRHWHHHRSHFTYGWPFGPGGFLPRNEPRPIVVRPQPEPRMDYGRLSRDHCREYQRDVVIGNQPATAYGTACLQPDGQWRIVSEADPIRDNYDWDGR